MKLDLQLDRIKDQPTREALSRIQDQFRLNPLLGGNWRQFDLEFLAAGSEVPIKHSLPFSPKDSIILVLEGDQNFYLRPDLFNSTHIYAEVGGPCRVRILVGRVDAV